MPRRCPRPVIRSRPTRCSHKGGDTGAYIVFTGHGYKGTVDSLNQFPGYSLAGIGDKNVTTIIFAATK